MSVLNFYKTIINYRKTIINQKNLLKMTAEPGNGIVRRFGLKEKKPLYGMNCLH